MQDFLQKMESEYKVLVYFKPNLENQETLGMEEKANIRSYHLRLR